MALNILPENVERIKALHNAGRNIACIARETGLSYQSLRKWLRKMPWYAGTKRIDKSPENIYKMRKMRISGMTYAAIGKEYGVKPGIIRNTIGHFEEKRHQNNWKRRIDELQKSIDLRETPRQMEARFGVPFKNIQAIIYVYKKSGKLQNVHVKPKNVITNEMVSEAIGLRLQGVPFAVTAEKMGVNLSAMYAKAKRHPDYPKIKGVKKKYRVSEEWRTMRNERLMTIISLREQGLSQRAIGKRLGLSAQRIQQILCGKFTREDQQVS